MKVVCLISGGMDSTTTAAYYKSLGHEVVGVFVDYGQITARKEEECAREFCRAWDIPFVKVTVDLRKVVKSTLVGTGPYEGSQPETTVPGRNALLLSIGAAYAMSHGFDIVAFGAHGLDSPYRDTHKQFISFMSQAFRYAYGVYVRAPFRTKAEIVEKARKLGVDLSKTWSCYYGTETPCGVCRACRAREKALGR